MAAKKKQEVIEPVIKTVDPDESANRVEGIVGVDPANAANIYATEYSANAEESKESDESGDTDKTEDKGGTTEPAKTPPAPPTK